MSSRFAAADGRCGGRAETLGLVPPPPGQRRLVRRLGHFQGFFDDVVRRIETEPAGTTTLAHLWDVEGDPRGSLLVRLWAFVAEGVAAYAELAAGEAYVGTAADWTDLRRLADLVGYAPRARVAAQGWIRAEVDRNASPLVPAGTRVQAPATATRAVQTFETVEDTRLHGDWTGLTATRPFARSTRPDGRTIRFGDDGGFRAGLQVLFLDHTRPEDDRDGSDAVTPLAVAGVVAVEADLGTFVVTFDRDLEAAFADAHHPAAHLIRESAGRARRLEDVVTVQRTEGGFAAETVALDYSADGAAAGASFVVVDTLLTRASTGSGIAIVNWGASRVALRSLETHVPVDWQVAPGTTVRVSRLNFEAAEHGLGEGLWQDGSAGVYVLDPPVSAANLVPDTSAPAGRLRLHPAPAVAPARLALATGSAWTVYACKAHEPASGNAMLVVLDGDPGGDATRWDATGNVVRVRHGTTTSAVVGSGDATRPFQELALPKAPVAHDLAADGTPVSSLSLRVDGVEWQEVATLYGQDDAQVYATTLAADGGETVRFGDGVHGARPTTGANNVAAVYRVGGGTEGEIGDGAITALLGQMRGVKKIAGGPTAGGAEQDDERRLRTLAPARARALGRIVSREDAVDLALAYPGVSHAAAWTAGGTVQLAFLRAGTSGPRAPVADEVRSLALYLADRRDTTFALRVVPARVTTVSAVATVALDPRFDRATVLAAATASLADPLGPLDPSARSLGRPLDPSDLYTTLHAVQGLVGVASLALGGTPADALVPLPADRDELLLLAQPATVQEATAE
ncbi:MAG TPA: hypothetical protein VFL66_07725 [Gaiellaceae bacterium]|nr:hypothetical protein [Gaiellaceae bacterium]